MLPEGSEGSQPKGLDDADAIKAAKAVCAVTLTMQESACNQAVECPESLLCFRTMGMVF